jgi:uncharacterized protein YigA (DUF484 family)
MGNDLPEKFESGQQAVSAAEVIEYLAGHPDFFAKHPDVLAKLIPPSEHKHSRANSVVDFQHFMLRRLQTDLARGVEERQDMIAHARTNLNLLTRIHACVLALLEATSFEEMITAITGDLAVYLDVDVAALMIESDDPAVIALHRGDIQIVRPGMVDLWMGNKDVLLRGDIEGDPDIYGDGAGLVHSEALLRLEPSHHAPVGMLAFGSRSSELFQDGQGTELVGFLARVVERCIRAWLDLPE